LEEWTAGGTLESMALETKDFSGAELAGLVRAASSHALARHLERGEPIQVTSSDFARGLSELRAQLGRVLRNRELERRHQERSKREASKEREAMQAAKQEATREAAWRRAGGQAVSREIEGPRGWSVAAVLRLVGLEEYEALLVDQHQIGWAELGSVTDGHLLECGVSLVGHRLRLLNGIQAALADAGKEDEGDEEWKANFLLN